MRLLSLTTLEGGTTRAVYVTNKRTPESRAQAKTKASDESPEAIPGNIEDLLQLIPVVMNALQPYAEAREAVSKAIRSLLPRALLVGP